jgi:hypothetical protein
MAQAAAQAFGVGQPGFVILLLLVYAIASWLAELIAGAVNKPNIGAMIKTASYIAAIIAVVQVTWQLLTLFFNFTQGKL